MYNKFFLHIQKKTILLATWLFILLFFWLLTIVYNVHWSIIFQELIQTNQYNWYGYIMVVVIYCIRPFFLIPVSRLSVVIWTFYGFDIGLLLALIGENISACVWYGLSKYFKFHIPTKYKPYFHILNKKQSILAVILSRLSIVPDDVNNYGWAMIWIWFVPYLIGTIIWNFIFTSINIWMGSSISDSWTTIITHPTLLLQNYNLLLAVFVYLVTLGISWRGIKYLIKQKTTI